MTIITLFISCIGLYFLYDYLMKDKPKRKTFSDFCAKNCKGCKEKKGKDNYGLDFKEVHDKLMVAEYLNTKWIWQEFIEISHIIKP